MSEAAVAEVRCLECQTVLAEGAARVDTESGVFCTSCFEVLKQNLKRAIAAQSQDIDYSRALLGAVAGGAAGAAVWWGFTVLTEIGFGLIAVVIGIAVGKGVLMATGGKRSTSLQGLSVAVAALSYLFATYFVNRSFLIDALANEGTAAALPLFPATFEMFFEMISIGFNGYDLLFLAFAMYEAWKIPAPIALPDQT